MEYTNLKTLLFQKGITIERVAEILGVHRNTVANKLNGESSFSIEEAFMIKNLIFPYYDLVFLFKRETSQKTA